MPTEQTGLKATAAELERVVKKAMRDVLREKPRGILTFERGEYGRSDYMLAVKAHDVLRALGDVADAVRNSVKYGDLDRRAHDVLGAVRQLINEAEYSNDIGDLCEEYGIGGGGGYLHLKLPPFVDVEWDFDPDSLDANIELRPEGIIRRKVRRAGVGHYFYEGPAFVDEWVEIGFVEHLDRRRAWHGYCRAAQVWSGLYDSSHGGPGVLEAVVRFVVDTDIAARANGLDGSEGCWGYSRVNPAKAEGVDASHE